ncbi:putative oxidoreductase (fatty acid repression mutant protein) [Chryseobacterium sp. BIGb0186]|nr:putative oxidoreductase (fatty acid repression mutant protein) [Chryseobacterium sp. JUb44]MDH6211997.1 putative oxidoreductase (fatty acid repression mutant protein) [Chryseobacterium sp. BIGb0186]
MLICPIAIGMEAVIFFLDSDARKNLKKDMSGQPDPSGWKSHGKGIAQNNKKGY